MNAKIQDRFAEGIMMTLIEEGKKVLNDKNNLEIRANLMMSATMALNGLIGSGVPQDWSSHGIGHELTGMFGIDHARTLSIVFPANLKVRKESKRDKLLQYAERVWGIETGSTDERIALAIESTELFFKDMAMPTRLREEGVGEIDIPSLIKQLEAHGMFAQGEGSDVDLTQCEQILKVAC